MWIDNWFLTPSQLQRSYQGDSNVIKKLKSKTTKSKNLIYHQLD